MEGINPRFAFFQDFNKLRDHVAGYGKVRIPSNLKLTRFVAEVNGFDHAQRQSFYLATCGQYKVREWHHEALKKTLVHLGV